MKYPSKNYREQPEPKCPTCGDSGFIYDKHFYDQRYDNKCPDCNQQEELKYNSDIENLKGAIKASLIDRRDVKLFLSYIKEIEKKYYKSLEINKLFDNDYFSSECSDSCDCAYCQNRRFIDQITSHDAGKESK